MPFQVVDLAAQARAVADYVRGWPKPKILAWLGQQGVLTQPIKDNPDLYVLYAPTGLATGFLLDDLGTFAIVGGRQNSVR